MPVVLFTQRSDQSQPMPKVDPTFLMMAASDLHEADRLVEPIGQVEAENIDLNNRPQVKNADGTTSTVRSITVTDDKGKATLIPTVVGDKVVSNDDAVAHYKKTGEHLGIFNSEHAANVYAEKLHKSQAKQYGLE